MSFPASELCERIRTYISLLLRWNQSISLTTVTNSDEILRFHFGESLFAASAFSLENGRLADVGSGAGFPGLPLAMLLPDLNVTLIESNAKKFTFLSEVVRELGSPERRSSSVANRGIRTARTSIRFHHCTRSWSVQNTLGLVARPVLRVGTASSLVRPGRSREAFDQTWLDLE